MRVNRFSAKLLSKLGKSKLAIRTNTIQYTHTHQHRLSLSSLHVQLILFANTRIFLIRAKTEFRTIYQTNFLI